MNKTERQTDGRAWKRSPKGNGKTTTVMAVNVDNDLVPYIQRAGNRSRLICDILRKYFTGNLEERK